MVEKPQQQTRQWNTLTRDDAELICFIACLAQWWLYRPMQVEKEPGHKRSRPANNRSLTPFHYEIQENKFQPPERHEPWQQEILRPDTKHLIQLASEALLVKQTNHCNINNTSIIDNKKTKNNIVVPLCWFQISLKQCH